jgi:hypothetical protein
MKIKSIGIPYISNIENEVIHVIVETEQGYCYNVNVVTPKTIESLMDKKKMNYLEVGAPFVIVKQLTKKSIREAIRAYTDKNDGYFLRLHHFARNINSTVFDQLDEENNQKRKERWERLFGE